jgi:2,3-bisphosphoglycerate-independent phosphoglycerate mutase
VTFFFNGGRETVFDGEERILVPSPKVATYDQQPQMSANEVTDKVVDAIKSAKFDLIVLNYANTDMVGHTGDIPAATAAVETVDTCLGRIATALHEAGGALVVTADHGNAEMMRDPETGEPHTAHTLNPVPFLVVGAPAAIKHVDKGRLCDIAPTLLDLLGVATPPAMTGRSLIAGDTGRRAAD